MWSVAVRRWTSAIGVVILMLGVCGSNGDGYASGPSPTTTSATAEPSTAAPAEGCENALSDIDDVDPGDPPGLCESGYPQPEPLDERATIRLGMSNTSIEVFAITMVALEAGEFDRENLDVQISIVPSADSIQLLADGQLDVTVSSPHAGVFNAIAQGFDVRWVAGQVRQPDEMKSGLWVREGVTIEDLPGLDIASTTGPGSNALLALYDATTEAGIDFSTLNIRQIAGVQEVVTALTNGGIDGGFVSPPFYRELETDGGFDYLVPQDGVGEAVGGVLFGPTMLENRELGEAFLRAYVRTVSTYFVGDYESDPEMVELMAAALDVSPDLVTETPAYIADYEIHRTTVDRLQGLYFAADVTSYGEDEGLTDADVVDRSFLEAAVGAGYGS